MNYRLEIKRKGICVKGEIYLSTGTLEEEFFIIKGKLKSCKVNVVYTASTIERPNNVLETHIVKLCELPNYNEGKLSLGRCLSVTTYGTTLEELKKLLL